MTSSPKTIKGFDCVEFKRNAQRRIYEEIKDLSVAEQIAYFRRKAEEGPLGQWWRQVKEHGAGSER